MERNNSITRNAAFNNCRQCWRINYNVRRYIITKTSKTFTLDSNNIQLELEEYSITLKIQALRGVLTSKTFHGEDCYLQLIGFMREAFSKGSNIDATIFIR